MKTPSTLAAMGAAALAMTMLVGCSSSSSEYSGDSVLQKSAQDACESAEGMPNLGVNFNWEHSLSGDFDPSFTDKGTFEWGQYTGDVERTYSFVCSGRFDDNHSFATAVLDDLNKTG